MAKVPSRTEQTRATLRSLGMGMGTAAAAGMLRERLTSNQLRVAAKAEAGDEVDGGGGSNVTRIGDLYDLGPSSPVNKALRNYGRAHHAELESKYHFIRGIYYGASVYSIGPLAVASAPAAGSLAWGAKYYAGAVIEAAYLRNPAAFNAIYQRGMALLEGRDNFFAPARGRWQAAGAFIGFQSDYREVTGDFAQ